MTRRRITSRTKLPKSHLIYYKALSAALHTPPHVPAHVGIAFDPSGDFTSRALLSVRELASDLSFGVYAPGTVFALGDARAVWNGVAVVAQ